MKKCRRWQKGLLSLVLACVLCACGMQNGASIGGTESDETTKAAESQVQTEPEEVKQPATEEPVAEVFVPCSIQGRPALIEVQAESSTLDFTPNISPYTVEPDLSNVENLKQFYFQEEFAQQLAKNGFIVAGEVGSEFFEVYESNRYMMIPNFITVDSLMHTYHLYFSYLLKNIELNYLSENLMELSRRMLIHSQTQYEALQGTQWEEAALRNVAFFTIGAKLMDDTTVVLPAAEEVVSTELQRIQQAEGIDCSLITGSMEDYTQYIPRGYYEGNEVMEKYFRAMMWYGRMHFKQEEEELDRSALLITKALSTDKEAYELWEGIYAVTTFFAGASDDLGVCEYAEAIEQAYGENASLEDFVEQTDAFAVFHMNTGSLRLPEINSLPIQDGEDNTILGFRFMGQRFSVDAAIMQRLIYQKVGENSLDQKRMLPDVLDVAAALGSDAADEILKEEGAYDYKNYPETMNELQYVLSKENSQLWNASLYAGWLNTLRPLLSPKKEGYPQFMQSEEWTKKDLECFAGSYAELKHDTILYSKQVMAEMGGGYEEDADFRGYVQPEPLVYERFAGLAEKTAEGLKGYGMLSEAEEENLLHLAQIAEQLLTISIKELQNEVLTEEEYTFIECYGGYIEHFWYEAVKDPNMEEQRIYSQDCPAAIVADIATDPNGTVLEVATGNPSRIYVVVEVDGVIKIATGSVYSFYQFPWPMHDRLTDTAWRQMMGWEADEKGYYQFDRPVSKPEWTESYRYRYEWE